MTQIVIDDAVAAHLASSAAGRGCSEADLASALLEQALRGDDQMIFAPKTVDRLRESIAQADRGELVDGDVVMARFANVLKEIEAR
jgi:hypothetical protein